MNFTFPKNLKDRVDFLLSKEKFLVGISSWAEKDWENQLRWIRPLEIGGGIIKDMNLCIDAYPNTSPEKFTINLLYKKSICRIDWGVNERHNNRVQRIKGVQSPPDLKLGLVYGSHIHSWNMNRCLAKFEELPEKLLFAEELPKNIRSFDQAIRHFCGLTNITILDSPILPSKDLLL